MQAGFDHIQHSQKIDQSQLLMRIKESSLFWKLRSKILNKVKQITPFDSLQEVGQSEISVIAQNELLEEQLKQLIMNYASKSIKREPISKDSLEFMNINKQKWGELLLKNYDYVSEKAKQLISENQEQEDILYFYDQNNLLNFLCQIQNPSQSNIQMSNKSFMVPTSFLVPGYKELKEKFSPLMYNDNIEVQRESGQVTQLKEREKKAKYIVENEILEKDIEILCQGGLPNGDRVHIYKKYFGIEKTKTKRFQEQFEEVAKKEFLIDKILSMDVEDVNDDDHYFVFQEQIQQVAHVFFRDPKVSKKLRILPQNYEQLSNSEKYKIPPCGLLPCKHFAKYIQPFGFCSQQNETIYAIFREFYFRYFCFLHTISSLPQSILGLCMIFEELLNYVDSKLFNHLISIGCQPLKIAFPLIFYCFIGTMETDQLFLLFDRIVGFRSLEILPIVAVGMFKKKSTQILQCLEPKEVEKLFQQYQKETFIELIKEVFNNKI